MYWPSSPSDLPAKSIRLEVARAELELPLALGPDRVEVHEELGHVLLDAGGAVADLPRRRHRHLALVEERPAHPLHEPAGRRQRQHVGGELRRPGGVGDELHAERREPARPVEDRRTRSDPRRPSRTAPTSCATTDCRDARASSPDTTRQGTCRPKQRQPWCSPQCCDRARRPLVLGGHYTARVPRCGSSSRVAGRDHRDSLTVVGALDQVEQIGVDRAVRARARWRCRGRS